MSQAEPVPATIPEHSLPPGVRDPEPDAELQVNQMVAEYKVTGVLGKGGMGTVYAGVQPVIGKRVAIKVLQREFVANRDVVHRFIQEARAVNQARSRYIVDIFSFGKLPQGSHYFVMEHIEGLPLRNVIEARGALPFDQAYEILVCVGRGLKAAHDKGIVHRDLKPENIIVSEESDGPAIAKILDFGIAKLQGGGAVGFTTRTGTAMGTPYYMSPEQCRGMAVDHRTDIYALGVIMFEMFTGVLPFTANSYIDLVNKHLFASPPALSELVSDVPSELEVFVLRCLSKDPGGRPESMEQFLAELSQLATSVRGTSVERSAAGRRADPAPPAGAGKASAKAEDVGQGEVPTAAAASAGLRRGRTSLQVALFALLFLALAGAGALTVYLLADKTDVGDDTETAGVAAAAAKRHGAAASRPTGVRAPDASGRALAPQRPGAGAPDGAPVVDSGAVGAVAAAPAQPSGQLSVRVNTPAVFTLDGKIVGRGRKLGLDQVVAGEHLLRVTARGRRPWQQRVTLRPGHRLELEVLLKAGRRVGSRKQRPPPGGEKGRPIIRDKDDTLNPFGT